MPKISPAAVHQGKPAGCPAAKRTAPMERSKPKPSAANTTTCEATRRAMRRRFARSSAQKLSVVAIAGVAAVSDVEFGRFGFGRRLCSGRFGSARRKAGLASQQDHPAAAVEFGRMAQQDGAELRAHRGRQAQKL